ncbi:putative Ig domain-containing protein [Bacteroidota bacterium]
MNLSKQIEYILILIILLHTTYIYASDSRNTNININSTEIELSLPDMTEALPGTLQIPLNVVNFNNVNSFTIKISFGTENVSFIDITDFPSAGLTFAANNGVITLGWFSITPLNFGDGVLCNINFDYSGGYSPLQFTGQNEITDLLGNPFDLVFTNGSIGSPVIITDEWVTFYSGNSTLDVNPVQINDTIKVFDPDSVLCGFSLVSIEGEYGFMNVYRDDLTTIDVDEGAEPGDTLYFYINDAVAKPLGPGSATWTTHLDSIELNLEAKSNWAPEILPIPDQVIEEGESFNIINLNDFVSDLNDDSNDLNWLSDGNIELDVSINEENFVSILIPDTNWFGNEEIIFTASDPGGLSDKDTVEFTVNPVNDTPKIISSSVDTVAQGVEYIYDVDAEDADEGDELTFSLLESPSFLGIDELTGVISGTPVEQDVGTDTVTVQVEDSAGAIDSQTYELTVVNVIECGDVNCDGGVLVFDAALLLRFFLGLDQELICSENGDVDMDGNLTAFDCANIARYAIGLDPLVPTCFDAQPKKSSN